MAMHTAVPVHRLPPQIKGIQNNSTYWNMYHLAKRKPILSVRSVTSIIGKNSALTILQYVNFINDKPIGRIKYALT